jgi:peptidoglycan hydrolase-like protein with peptidoglycan-binding domain
MERHAHGPERRLRWRLHELPLLEIVIDVDVVAAGGANGANGQSTTGVNASGAGVAALQSQLTTLGYAIPTAEQTAKRYGVGTRDAVSEFQGKSHLAVTGVDDEFTSAALADAVAAQTGGRQVQGRIVLDNGLPANGLKVRLYNRVFGGTATSLGEAVTDANGYYTLPYTAVATNLEVRTVDAQGKETPLSTTRFGARNKEILNLVAPASVKPALSEYQRLTADLAPHVGGALATAKENDQQQDLSLLHQATGWDARLVALAATAAQQSAKTNVPAEALYALYRSGLPTDPVQLARASTAGVDGALKSARDAGVISMSDDQIKSAQEAVTRAAPALLLAAKAPGALSAFSDLLVNLPTQQQTQFAQLYLQNPDGGQPLWDAAKAAGFTDPQISTLRLQGKLAYLTLNNAPLLASLRDEIGAPETVAKLADGGLYRDDAWRARLDRLSGGDAAKLKALIPPAYSGDADLYSADLARRVRISFPTHVVTNMIEKDELKLGTDSEHAAAKGPVSGFLRKALPLGFRLGHQSVDRFVKQNQNQLFDQGQDPTATVAGVKRLQRLFQMTPSNDALQTMYALGFQSSRDVSRYSEDDFIANYAKEFVDEGAASLIIRRAHQISSATYAFFTLTKQLDDTATVYGYSASQDQTQQIKDGLIERFPSIEQLFGPVDFCACKDCRSVLSPAAYLVDLLHMLDPDSGLNPLAVLSDRRPDLVNLPLSCENTNTVLPYVDIVNEILEYYVANGALDAKAVRDTGDAKSEDLISEPQNILKDAYDSKLKPAIYPLGLPFNLWLETVRGFLDHFDTPFWQLLELFRANDELFGTGAGYYRASVLSEMLLISPQEYGVFTNSDPLPKWLDLYGETDATKLPNAQYLSRKLGVSYEELAALVQTWFVNPGLDALVPLRRLSLPLDQIYRYKNDARYPAFTTDEKNAFVQHLQDIKDQTKFDASAWLETTWQSGAFDRALVLYDTGAGCDFSKTLLQYANGNAAEPLALIRLNYFVRLWRKLGWSIDLVDQALRVFMPTDPNPITDKDLGKAMASALVYLAHLDEVATRLPIGKDARLKLLSLWAPLSTRGQDPLYAKLFLTPSVLKLDAATFDSIQGDYLPKTTTVNIVDHQSAVQAALNLTADEIAQILQAGNANATPANTLLTLDNVSQLYRHGVLAHALKLSVADLIELIKLSGLQPFHALEPKALGAVADDHPLKETLAFADIAAAVRASGFTVESLAYVWAHQFDPAGKYADDETALLSLVRGLSGDIDQIDQPSFRHKRTK